MAGAGQAAEHYHASCSTATRCAYCDIGKQQHIPAALGVFAAANISTVLLRRMHICSHPAVQPTFLPLSALHCHIRCCQYQHSLLLKTARALEYTYTIVQRHQQSSHIKNSIPAALGIAVAAAAKLSTVLLRRVHIHKRDAAFCS
jgi:hypothetical protein